MSMEKRHHEGERSASLFQMKNILCICLVFSFGFLLGENTNKTIDALRSMAVEEPMDGSLFPTKKDVVEIFDRGLEDENLEEVDFSFEGFDDVGMDFSSVVMGEDGEIYDDEILIQEEVISSLEDLTSHTNHQDEFRVEEKVIMDEEIAMEPTEEEIEDPEILLYESDEPDFLDYERRLYSNTFHKPLPCNNDLEQQPCTSFKNFIDNRNEDSALVVPCGSCFEMDYQNGEVIDLPQGLSINGKLYFPSSANITLRTKFVWVAGILKIDLPNLGNQVKFTLYGEETQTFSAINPDSPICGSEMGGCNLGSKVIAVVGGKLDIQGAEDNCPAWEKLTDVGNLHPPSFTRDLPCSSHGECWEEDTIRLRGKCFESGGHTQNLKKYTVACPIERTADVGKGTRMGIKLTSIEGPDPEFHLPKDEDGKRVELNLDGECRVSGSHTKASNKCVIYCPLQKTVQIGSGSQEPLLFTSVAAKDDQFKMPEKNGEDVSLVIKDKCWNSRGHTKAFNRCAIQCNVFPTIDHRTGENSGKLTFTSTYNDQEIQFPVPVKGGVEGKFILSNQCQYMGGHTKAWNGCVVRCPVERTRKDFGSFHSSARLNNKGTGEFVDVKRILSYAHGGVHMYLLLQDVSKDQCAFDGADTLNSVFKAGDEIVPSYQLSTDPSKDGETFDVDKIIHYAWKKKTFIFLPSESDKDTCGSVAEEFSSKFPSGYGVKINYNNSEKPPGGESFGVDTVRHWAWKGKTLYFTPEKTDVDTCHETADEFNSKFGRKYSIEVNRHPKSFGDLNQVVEASNGVHHWSWKKNLMFFFPDETAAQINHMFPIGTKLKVEYLDSTETSELKVSQEALDCWKPGSEILLTSSTRSMQDQSVRTIKSSDNGLLELSASVRKPLSKADHEDFAIEVAPLSRRIIFEAESDSTDDKIGGHLIVHHTDSPQTIEGVEVRNFGQQGRLGRYPIHFHKCGDSPSSIVRKNVVRNSKQRCFVVHLSNNVTMEENVAYDAFGHCYFIEDGREVGNIFRKNLGSGIKRMPTESVEKLSEKSNRKESDGASSVFWISNANNYFYGNIAAGGEGHGYWFETHGNLRHTNLGAFEDNEVHSSRRFAFTTYSPGWRPKDVATLKNLKVYRNPTWGAFLHVTQNLVFDGGLFADNGDKAVMISRGDDLVFKGTTFIGQTDFVGGGKCNWGKVGIHLDPYRLKETVVWDFSGNTMGSIVENAVFKNWTKEATGCDGNYPLKFFSHQTFIKSYSAPHVFKDLIFDSDYSIQANLSYAGIDDIHVEVSSDVNNAFGGTEPGFFVNPKIESMLPASCENHNEGLKFCPGACIRTLSILTGNSAFEDSIEMVVTDVNDRSREIGITKDVRGHPGPQPVANRFFGVYTVALPKSAYEISFRDTVSGSLSWPKYAFIVPEHSPVSCKDFVEGSDLTFVKPSSDRAECDELIWNGNFDDGGKDGWYASHHPIALLEDGGIDGSAALATTKPLNSGNQLTQSIDGTCLEVGDKFDVSVSFKIIDWDGSRNNIPYVRLEAQNYSGKKLKTSVANVFRLPAETEIVRDGWNTITGVWTINEQMASADKHKFHIGGGNYKVAIDNVSIQRLHEASPTLRRRTF